MKDHINFQDLFEGFQNTALLWERSAVYNFEQFQPKSTSHHFTQSAEPKQLRLGKWVEKFIAFQLQKDATIKILEENLQIKDHKITIGELDLVILKKQQPIHLEIVYKFYLYNPKQDSTNALDPWVGPNKNDALIYKLNKLKEKQLPLLYHPKTTLALERHSLDVDTIKQKVCFKAQLFLPYKKQHIDVFPLNSDCVSGWYLNFESIDELRKFQFYIPEKLEWLCTPKPKVTWFHFDDAFDLIKTQIQNKRSPLCWIKNDINALQKCFITWW
ncbi:MAG: DUF1853 family protein [Winogradskyella sp.]|uniref:DUF1853 family protein n=1 Tax=Winogradskyella sp. TaxID=1883156 RepID=UPI00385E8A1D